MNMHPEEVEERKAAFQKLWRDQWVKKVSEMHPWYQGTVHDMLKRAFYDGTNFERRKHEPMQIGGAD